MAGGPEAVGANRRHGGVAQLFQARARQLTPEAPPKERSLPVGKSTRGRSVPFALCTITLLVAALFPAAADAAFGDRTLKRGVKGADVKTLQIGRASCRESV